MWLSPRWHRCWVSFGDWARSRCQASAPATPVEALLNRYQRYLISDRGLAVSTARRYTDMARPFLVQQERAGGSIWVT